MRFASAPFAATAALALLATASTAAAQQPTPPPGPDVPPGYENQPPGQGQPQQPPPPPPSGWTEQPPPGQGGTYPQSAAYPPGGTYPPPAAEPPPPEPEGAQHSVSITLSPFHLFLPVVELMGEFWIQDWFGLAAIVGGGAIREDISGAGETFSVFELGTQALLYPVGDFDHGMQLGAEILYIHVSAELDSGVTGTGSGLSIAPLIGYKWAAGFGFTVNVQGGVAIAGIAAETSDGTTTEEDSTVEILPLVNLNVGWSF